MAYTDDEKNGPDLEQEDRVSKVFQRWQDARDGLNAWREEAKTCYDFEAGHQWSEEDLAILTEQERPAVTFNRMGVMIDAVAGLEVNTRQQITYFPREQGDVQVSEIETAAARWVLEQCHGEDQESEAFRDATICGVGVTETRMDYEQDADGMIVEERRDPLKTTWDPAAHKKCNADARYVFYADWMDNQEIDDTWPDRAAGITPGVPVDDARRPQNADRQFLYKDTDGDLEKHKDQSMVVQYQCYWREPYYRVLDPQSGQLVDFDKAKFTKVRKAYKDATGEDLKFVKQMKRVYYRGFYCGRTELEYGKSPCQDGFTFKFITCKRDRNMKMWYGIVRAMMDPQRWANKWLSQILHIINTNAKGGAFVETNALKDPRKAEEQWAASNPLIELNEGGINKIKERTPAQTPNGLDKLMGFAFDSLPYVSGINLEALGLANREQAGVLEAQRRKAAYGILAPLFDALRLYRKEQGKLLLYFIREFISDGRLIRVSGQNNTQKYLPLIKDPKTQQYDIVIDQSPTSPDFREKSWDALKEILPVMMKEGIPLPPSAFDAMPIPSAMAQEFKQMMAQRGQVPPEVQQKMEEMQKALQAAGQENQSLKMQNSELRVGAQVDILKVHAKHAEAQDKNQVKVYQTQVQAAVDRANAQLKAHVDQVTAHLDRKSEEMKHVTQIIADFRSDIMKMKQAETADKAAEAKKAESKPADKPAPPPEIHVHMPNNAGKVTKKKGKATKNPDGSFTLDSEERVE